VGGWIGRVEGVLVDDVEDQSTCAAFTKVSCSNEPSYPQRLQEEDLVNPCRLRWTELGEDGTPLAAEIGLLGQPLDLFVGLHGDDSPLQVKGRTYLHASSSPTFHPSTNFLVNPSLA